MPAPALATMPTCEMVFFGKDHIALRVEVEILSFNERLLNTFRWFWNHLK